MSTVVGSCHDRQTGFGRSDLQYLSEAALRLPVEAVVDSQARTIRGRAIAFGATVDEHVQNARDNLPAVVPPWFEQNFHHATFEYRLLLTQTQAQICEYCHHLAKSKPESSNKFEATP